MKNKILIISLLVVFCLNIKLISENYRLKNEYKILSSTVVPIYKESVDIDNKNLSNLHKSTLLIKKLDIKELNTIEVTSEALILTIEVSTIERIREIESTLSDELELGIPEMELYFDNKKIKGMLRYRGAKI